MAAHLFRVEAAVLLVLACGCGGTATPPGKMPITTSSVAARHAFLDGRAALESLRPIDARAAFSRAVELDPSFALAHLGLAQTATRIEERRAGLEAAARFAPQASAGEAAMIRAAIASTESRPDDQEKELKALVATYPEDERALTTLGNFYFNRGEWKTAIDDYKKAITINPDFAQPYNQLGYAFRHIGDLDAAEKAFRRYAELLPSEPNPYDSYAELLLQRGRFEDALAQYGKALDVDPNFGSSYVGMGCAYIFLGRNDQARTCFAKLAFIARNDAERRDALFWQAASWLFEGNREQALVGLAKRREVALRSGDRVALAGDWQSEAEVLLDAGRLVEARAAFDRAIAEVEASELHESVKANVRLRHVYNLARLAIAGKDFAAAQRLTADYRRDAQPSRHPSIRQRAHELDGLLALATGDGTGAVSELLKADQDNPRILFTLAKAYLEAGDRRSARAVCERVVHFNAPVPELAFVWLPAQALLRTLDAPAPATLPSQASRHLVLASF